MKFDVYELNSNFVYREFIEGDTIEEALDCISTSWVSTNEWYSILWRGVLMASFILTDKLELEVEIYYNDEEEYRNDRLNA